MKKSFIVMAALFIMSSLFVVSCGGGSSSSSTTTTDGPTIGVTIYRYDDNFMSFYRRNIETRISGKANLIINDSQNNQAQQNDQVDVMIQKDSKALAINLVDPQAAQTIIDKAKTKNIPVVFFNKQPSAEAMASYDKTWYVGTTPEESGDMQGKIVVDTWKANPAWDKNGDGIIQYALLKGEPGHPDAEARTSHVTLYVTNNGLKVEKLEEQTAMWDTAKAKDIVDAWIQKYGDKLEYIFCNNDAMALGALQAVQALGYNKEGDTTKFIPIVGVDAIPDMINEIKKGTVVGSVLNDPVGQSQALVDITLNVAAGKDPLDGTTWTLDEVKAVRVPYVPITKDNINVAEEAYK
ncbi:galactose/glucose ABC transporter substrate-binding protein MglB [Brachyspira hyodysenteriae]|uniref:D-galactose/methyl-galactoside binding periplasmic protein MglB n=1 Tax=Brachyspira hyodysenteriae (strain ATCC 49526 / WA1) TaxID=565034 RepID=A0A3B6VAJ6_BRAHW|nr:galactose ABC transporter substrate-binding protein [Brachyspira hyodysenteriae]ACN85005.1 galactose/glucose-binding protein [Brachyspira hyodysenteriae WA1]AUJ50724.1 galactose ABC transporter substrate-binding protein [Brachyspira hyodysenteriae]KLI19646.1 methyl-galactoside ABC transporter substrate-binding protein [Brachyspira hyodysenteriae]KLI26738.1 methyl-galactoside ABC transporter substrate-binding protein [Brachyspira hyodysenteriae]KLI30146.1 methyl-galactoside ABC transporter s